MAHLQMRLLRWRAQRGETLAQREADEKLSMAGGREGVVWFSPSGEFLNRYICRCKAGSSKHHLYLLLHIHQYLVYTMCQIEYTGFFCKDLLGLGSNITPHNYQLLNC